MRKLSIATRLWASIGALLFATLAISGAVIAEVNGVADRSSDDLTRAKDLVTRAQRWRGLIDTTGTQVMATTAANDPVITNLFKGDLASAPERIKAMRLELTKSATTKADAVLFEKITNAGRQLAEATAKLRKRTEFADARARMDALELDYLPAANAYVKLIDEFVALQESKVDAVLAKAATERGVAAAWGTAGVVTLMCLTSYIGYLIVRAVRRPLQQLVGVAGAIAAGDLSPPMPDDRGDEFGELLRALQRMADSLAGLVQEVKHATDSIAIASHQIAAGNIDLSNRTERAAASLQETNASMMEISQTVAQNADAAHDARRLAHSTNEAAQGGAQVVERVIETMRQISDGSEQINEITAVIDSLAFRTNILALNASVEAARAGEQGRGFAVVASEVRALAQRSAEAAKEIKMVIKSSAEVVDAGARHVSSAGDAMQNIQTSVGRLHSIVDSIATASSDQAAGIAKINEVVKDLDQATQQNAALVEEASAASASMLTRADHVTMLMNRFRLPAQST